MDLKYIGVNTRSWINSAQATDYWRDLLNAALNIRVLLVIELVILYAAPYKMFLQPYSLP
jgi:hypothetical protein